MKRKKRQVKIKKNKKKFLKKTKKKIGTYFQM